MAVQGQWSSKVADFGSNRKRVCDFLLVVNSNFGSFLLHFRDYAENSDPPLFHRSFVDVPLGLDSQCWGAQGAKTLS